MSGERNIRNIIVVDNSTSMLFYLGTILKRLGYKAVMARTAEDALHLLEEGAPACMLTEISLPGMHGMDFLRHLKDSSHLRTVPVVIHTSEADPGLKDSCLNLGCAAYLTKPADPEALFHAVESASDSRNRHSIRISTSLPVVVTEGTGPDAPAREENATAISEGGLYVRTLRVRPKDTVLPVTIVINGQEIRATARVLYRYTLGKGPFKEPGMGMKFIDISDSDRELIRQFIREQLMSDVDLRKE